MVPLKTWAMFLVIFFILQKKLKRQKAKQLKARNVEWTPRNLELKPKNSGTESLEPWSSSQRILKPRLKDEAKDTNAKTPDTKTYSPGPQG